MFAGTGSTKTAAISPPRWAKTPSSPSRSLKGRTIVSATLACGTPAAMGIPKVAADDPALARKASAWPW